MMNTAAGRRGRYFDKPTPRASRPGQKNDFFIQVRDGSSRCAQTIKKTATSRKLSGRYGIISSVGQRIAVPPVGDGAGQPDIEKQICEIGNKMAGAPA